MAGHMSRKLGFAAVVIILVTFVLIVGPLSLGYAQQQTPHPRPSRDSAPPHFPQWPSNANGQSAQPMLPSATADYGAWSKITFQSYRDGNWEIYLANGDGTGQMRLTANAASDTYPRLNRGGTRIVFSSNRTGTYEIYTMNLDGTGLSRLTISSGNNYDPAWSPDGSKIAFTSFRDNQAEIYVMNANGTGLTRLTNNPAFDGYSVWSPDGTKIAFTSDRGTPANTGDRVWVMNADGSSPQQLTTQYSCQDPIWSPDGTRIAYDADVTNDNTQELMLMNADGSGQRQVYDPPDESPLGYPGLTDAWVRSWSPDGKFIAFTRLTWIYYQGTWYWYTGYLEDISTDTSASPSQLVPTQGDDWYPDWQTSDIQAPTSSMTALPTTSPSPIVVNWTGSDVGLSGIQGYEVQVKDGAGPWTMWLSRTVQTSADYAGIGGHTYAFRVRAIDNANNVQVWPANAQASATVESLPPTSAINSLPAYWRGELTVSWGGSDPGGSGIQNYDVQVRDGVTGTWTDWLMGTGLTSANFNGTVGHTYYFRARGIDRALNIEDWPTGDGDGQVTFYDWQARGTVHDNAGAPISNAQINLTPSAFGTQASDLDGVYAAYALASTGAYTATWLKPTYGDLPFTRLDSSEDSVLDVVLPPVDNLVQNWGFEAGLLGPTDWQASGTLSTEVTSTLKHTGNYAMLLGESPVNSFGPIEHIGEVGVGTYGDAGYPRLAVDSLGVVHMVWTSWSNTPEGYQLFYASGSPDGTWTTPLILAESIWANQADIAVDHLDNIHVVWAGASIGYRMKYKTGGWSTPITVPNANFSAYDPSIAIDNQNNVHIVWSGRDDNTSNTFTLWYAHKTGDTWASAVPIMGKEVFGFSPRLAVDQLGALHVLYEGLVNYEWAIFYISRTRQGTWTAPLQLSAISSMQPDLAIDVNGTVHGVWHSYAGGLASLEYARKQPDTSWSQPITIATGSNIAAPSIVAIDHSLHLVYQQDNFTWSIQYIQKSPQGSWTTPITFSSDPNAVNPDLVELPGGALSSAWSWATSGPNGHGEIQYRGPTPATTTGDAMLAQALTVPVTFTTPVLSFAYQLGSASSLVGSGLTVTVDTPVSSNAVLTSATGTRDWAYRSVDLSAWAGQSITLTFGVHQVAGTPRTWALLDEISLGSTFPDVWVKSPDIEGHREETVTYLITYGNQGGATAQDVAITLTLPSELSLITADPMPASQTSLLTWDVGDLPARSGPFTITLTAQISRSVMIPGTVIYPVEIRTLSQELETANNIIQIATVLPPFKLYLPIIRR